MDDKTWGGFLVNIEKTDNGLRIKLDRNDLPGYELELPGMVLLTIDISRERDLIFRRLNSSKGCQVYFHSENMDRESNIVIFYCEISVPHDEVTFEVHGEIIQEQFIEYSLEE